MAINGLKTQSLGSGLKRQWLTTSGQFIVPDGVYKLRIILASGGGGGCGSVGLYTNKAGIVVSGGEAGRSGYLIERSMAVFGGQTINYTLGPGGAGGTGIKYDLGQNIGANANQALIQGLVRFQASGGTGGTTSFGPFSIVGGIPGSESAYYAIATSAGFNYGTTSASYDPVNLNSNWATANALGYNGVPVYGGPGGAISTSGTSGNGYEVTVFSGQTGKIAPAFGSAGYFPFEGSANEIGLGAGQALQLAGGGGSGGIGMYYYGANGVGGGLHSSASAGGAGGNPTPVIFSSIATAGLPGTLAAITNDPRPVFTVDISSFAGVGTPQTGGGAGAGSTGVQQRVTNGSGSVPQQATDTSRIIGLATPGQGGDGGYACGGGAAGVAVSTTAANTGTARGGNGGPGFVIVEWRE